MAKRSLKWTGGSEKRYTICMPVFSSVCRPPRNRKKNEADFFPWLKPLFVGNVLCGGLCLCLSERGRERKGERISCFIKFGVIL